MLTDEDIVHYQKIVVALNETIRLMGEIDEVIENHGGWPGAFQREEKGKKSTDVETQADEMLKVAEDGSSYESDPKRSK